MDISSFYNIRFFSVNKGLYLVINEVQVQFFITFASWVLTIHKGLWFFPKPDSEYKEENLLINKILSSYVATLNIMGLVDLQP